MTNEKYTCQNCVYMDEGYSYLKNNEGFISSFAIHRCQMSGARSMYVMPFFKICDDFMLNSYMCLICNQEHGELGK